MYSRKRGVMGHCDGCVTLLGDTDVSFGLFNIFTYLDMPFG